MGPGTGYFLDRSGLADGSRVTILDPNPNVLEHASRHLRRLDVTAVEADVLKPLPVVGPFDSAALNLVIHCLPGPMTRKAAAIADVAAVLAPERRAVRLRRSWERPDRTRGCHGGCSTPSTDATRSTTWPTPSRASGTSWGPRSNGWSSRPSARSPSLPPRVRVRAWSQPDRLKPCRSAPIATASTTVFVKPLPSGVRGRPRWPKARFGPIDDGRAIGGPSPDRQVATAAQVSALCSDQHGR